MAHDFGEWILGGDPSGAGRAMMRAVQFESPGGPEVMHLVERSLPSPGPGEILLRHTAIGVNFIDTYHRSGLYPVRLPSGLGTEAVGVVEAVGTGVNRFTVGDRAAYAGARLGAYAEASAIPAEGAVRVPDAISDEIAAASMLKGMTVHYLVKKTFPLRSGHVALVYAAAGGVGQILVQWASRLGARVIAVVGSEKKAEIPRRLGASEVLVSRAGEGVAERVRALTDQRGVDVAYDSVGRDTYEATLDSLAVLGSFVSYGSSSGILEPIDAARLTQKGSLFFTRPGLFHYIRTPELLDEAAGDLFEALDHGIVEIAPPTMRPLKEIVGVHRDLEARRLTGSVVLLP